MNTSFSRMDRVSFVVQQSQNAMGVFDLFVLLTMEWDVEEAAVMDDGC